MMRRLCFLLVLLPLMALASPDTMRVANLQLKEILAQNNQYITDKGSPFFKLKSQGQNPRITLVTCSDSRVHTSIIDEMPEGNLFIIRNIGNQITTAQGSVKYGVNYFHTPLLLIVGHSQCGAISASLNHLIGLETSIREELASLHLNSGETNIEGVKTNVHNQVAIALKMFQPAVKQNELLIVGAVYDFSNDMKLGFGRLNVINIQGKQVEPESLVRDGL